MRGSMSERTNNLPISASTSRRNPMTAQPADIVRDVLNHEFGRFKFGVQLLARAAGVSPRTAGAWLNGRAAPNLSNLVPLMANCDALATAILSLVEERRKMRE